MPIKKFYKNFLIIPVRGYELDKNYLKKSKFNYFYTIDVAIKVKNIDKIILSCADTKLLRICKKKYKVEFLS